MNTTFLNAIAPDLIGRLTQAQRGGAALALTGVPESQAVFLAAQLAAKTDRRVLIALPNDLRAMKAGEDAATLLPDRTAALPGGEIELSRGASSHESAWRRIETLTALCEGRVRLLTTSVEALMQRMGDAELFRSGILRLAPGDTVQPMKLVEQLIRMGYERVEMVEGKGQCALRGAIVDVYPPSEAAALRIEFFDDEIDTIRSFDAISQRSHENMKRARIAPACEALIPPEEAEAAAERLRSMVPERASAPEVRLLDDLPPLPDDDDELAEAFDKHIAPKVAKKQRQAELEMQMDRRRTQLLNEAEQVAQGVPFRRIRAFLPVLSEQRHSLIDWYRPDFILLAQPDQLRERCTERLAGFREELQTALERGEAVPQQAELLNDWDGVLASFADIPVIAVTEFLRGMGGLNIGEAVDLKARGAAPYQGRVKDLAADCKKWMQAGYCAVLLSGGVARGERLAATLQENGAQAIFTDDLRTPVRGQAFVLPGTYSHGFLWPEGNFVFISDTDIYGQGYRKAKSRRSAGEKIAAFTDLKPGDYVVHEDHGVGIYRGVIQMNQEGTKRDYLLIDYQDSDKLYVPVEQLERVQRYIGNPNDPPKLSRLGSSDWQRQKSKVREGLKKLAFDLVKLYAERSGRHGYAFGPDTPWQREFEDRFPYELTPDQQQSVDEITKDMESDRNMDRLLCGDVGYGKTEVALRAVFKAIMDGKQAAILAPTTILAQQHYNTAVARFQGFPVNIDVLSRFRTTKEQKEIVERLKNGQIDLLIGTHRMLAKDVQFRNLGLLIVDEEQRFGVSHKEIIKRMKTQMDVLTLSATPIPRTLHMSMVGIRDMSVLETPPEDRLPVQTHVVDYSDALIRDAILRELARGGQVYFLYNRVRSIERFYERLKQLVPEARVGVAHGQMREHGLEDVMMDFYSGSYDVLLCTTIIESGLDVPTANTLIVYDADRFGLSQLYQLRGRVGRSSRQAYAYFTVRPDKLLSETAQQRLSAIREFTEFGAGFRIAMRDLEIRGAGNILGPEQHGHLATVGYDMYCKLMEETLREAQGAAPLEQPLETRVDLQVDAYVPEDYIADEKQRMEMYKRIAAIRTADDRAAVIDEMVDRFGEPPAAVETLLDVAQLRAFANRLGAQRVLWRGGELTLRIDGKYAPDGAMLIEALKVDPRFRIITSPPSIALKDVRLPIRAMLREGVRVLEKVCARLDRLREEKQEAAT